MAKYIKINEPTPHGGAYSEIYFFDKDGRNVDEQNAIRSVIRECDKNGNLVHEIWSVLKECET